MKKEHSCVNIHKLESWKIELGMPVSDTLAKIC